MLALSTSTFCGDGIFCICAVQYVQLLSTWNVASEAKELNFKFYLMLINFTFKLK